MARPPGNSALRLERREKTTPSCPGHFPGDLGPPQGPGKDLPSPPSVEDTLFTAHEGWGSPCADRGPGLRSSGPAEGNESVFEQHLRTQDRGSEGSGRCHSYSAEHHPPTPCTRIPLNKAISS